MIKLVCFDLDDTLIKDIHSVMLLCILNDKEREHRPIQLQEESGELDYVTADHKRAKLATGLRESAIRARILDIIKPLKSIPETVESLHTAGIKIIVITAGPKQVAKVVCDLWGFDGYYGSDYEVVDGHFTGIITNHIGDVGKISCLMDYCNHSGIAPEECVAVGDGGTDIPLFEFCGKSIAINAKPLAAEKADVSVTTDSIGDILPYIY